MSADPIDNLWGSFDLISAELVKAKRALREGRGREADGQWLWAERMDIGIELSQLGELGDPPNPAIDPCPVPRYPRRMSHVESCIIERMPAAFPPADAPPRGPDAIAQTLET